MTLNYAELQAAARKEKGSPRLQEIPKGFYADLRKLLCELNGEYRESALRLAEEVYFTRVGKVLRLASMTGDKSQPGNMIHEDVEVYNQVLGLISKHKEELFDIGSGFGEEIGEAEEIKKEEEEDDRVLVRMLSPIPAIMGSDLSHYGPFEEGDEAKLPGGTAKILADQGVAEIL